MMKNVLVTAAVLTALAAPVHAQESSDTQEGFSLMEEGAKLLLRGLKTSWKGSVQPCNHSWLN